MPKKAYNVEATLELRSTYRVRANSPEEAREIARRDLENGGSKAYIPGTPTVDIEDVDDITDEAEDDDSGFIES